jgi:hypothetical protein
VAAAVAATPARGLTPVVEMQSRSFVVQVEGREPPREVPLAEVKEQLAKALLAERKRSRFMEWFAERRRAAQVKIYL